MKTKLIASLMLAAGTMFAGPRIGIGIGVGVPVAPAPYVAPAPVVVAPPVAYAAPAPGPGYVWTPGYYNFVYGRRVWHAGYWRAPVVRFGYRGYGYRRGFRR